MVLSACWEYVTTLSAIALYTVPLNRCRMTLGEWGMTVGGEVAFDPEETSTRDAAFVTETTDR